MLGGPDFTLSGLLGLSAGPPNDKNPDNNDEANDDNQKGERTKTHDQMFDMLEFATPLIPEDKPIHLLGIGDLHSLENCIKYGIDTFDSSHPTKCARHGLIFTKNGNLKITRNSNREIFEPIDRTCPCITCQKFTIGYLHHLFKAKEPVAHTLATIHNVQFMVDLMADYRNKILNNEL